MPDIQISRQSCVLRRVRNRPETRNALNIHRCRALAEYTLSEVGLTGPILSVAEALEIGFVQEIPSDPQSRAPVHPLHYMLCPVPNSSRIVGCRCFTFPQHAISMVTTPPENRRGVLSC